MPLVLSGIIVFAFIAGFCLVPHEVRENLAHSTEALLGSLVTITGVTVPLIIVYLTTQNSEIRHELTQIIESSFSKTATSIERFVEVAKRQRNVEQLETTNKTNDTPSSIEIVYACFLQSGEFDYESQRFRPFPLFAKKRLMPNNDGLVASFEYFHDQAGDKRFCLTNMVVLTVALLLSCSDLYLRDVLGRDWNIVELALAPMLAVLNLTVGFVLAQFVLVRSTIKAIADSNLWYECHQAKISIPALEQFKHDQVNRVDEAAKRLVSSSARSTAEQGDWHSGVVPRAVAPDGSEGC